MSVSSSVQPTDRSQGLAPLGSDLGFVLATGEKRPLPDMSRFTRKLYGTADTGWLSACELHADRDLAVGEKVTAWLVSQIDGQPLEEVTFTASATNKAKAKWLPEFVALVHKQGVRLAAGERDAKGAFSATGDATPRLWGYGCDSRSFTNAPFSGNLAQALVLTGGDLAEGERLCIQVRDISSQHLYESHLFTAKKGRLTQAQWSQDLCEQLNMASSRLRAGRLVSATATVIPSASEENALFVPQASDLAVTLARSPWWHAWDITAANPLKAGQKIHLWVLDAFSAQGVVDSGVFVYEAKKDLEPDQWLAEWATQVSQSPLARYVRLGGGDGQAPTNLAKGATTAHLWQQGAALRVFTDAPGTENWEEVDLAVNLNELHENEKTTVRIEVLEPGSRALLHEYVFSPASGSGAPADRQEWLQALCTGINDKALPCLRAGARIAGKDGITAEGADAKAIGLWVPKGSMLHVHAGRSSKAQPAPQDNAAPSRAPLSVATVVGPQVTPVKKYTGPATCEDYGSTLRSEVFDVSGDAQTGVDPRTGLFHAHYPVASLQGLGGRGPVCDLTLHYSALRGNEAGLGDGWAFRFSSLETRDRSLVLATGQSLSLSDEDWAALGKGEILRKRPCWISATADYKIITLDLPGGRREVLTAPVEDDGQEPNAELRDQIIGLLKQIRDKSAPVPPKPEGFWQHVLAVVSPMLYRIAAQLDYAEAVKKWRENTTEIDKAIAYWQRESVQLVPSAIISPQGEEMTLAWKRVSGQYLLQKIQAGESVLLKAEYHQPENSGTWNEISLKIWPGSVEEYSVKLELDQYLLKSLRRVDKVLGMLQEVWFDYCYDPTLDRVLYQVRENDGSLEWVQYSAEQVKPYSGAPGLPRVTRHVIEPGAEQPAVATDYEYSLSVTLKDKEDKEITLTQNSNYLHPQAGYAVIATRGEVEQRVIRQWDYNDRHQLVRERTRFDGNTHVVCFLYVGGEFEEPARGQIGRIVTFTDLARVKSEIEPSMADMVRMAINSVLLEFGERPEYYEYPLAQQLEKLQNHFFVMSECFLKYRSDLDGAANHDAGRFEDFLLGLSGELRSALYENGEIRQDSFFGMLNSGAGFSVTEGGFYILKNEVEERFSFAKVSIDVWVGALYSWSSVASTDYLEVIMGYLKELASAILIPDSACGSDAVWAEQEFVYDNSGRLVERVDPDGTVTQRRYYTRGHAQDDRLKFSKILGNATLKGITGDQLACPPIPDHEPEPLLAEYRYRQLDNVHIPIALTTYGWSVVTRNARTLLRPTQAVALEGVQVDKFKKPVEEWVLSLAPGRTQAVIQHQIFIDQAPHNKTQTEDCKVKVWTTGLEQYTWLGSQCSWLSTQRHWEDNPNHSGLVMRAVTQTRDGATGPATRETEEVNTTSRFSRRLLSTRRFATHLDDHNAQVSEGGEEKRFTYDALGRITSESTFRLAKGLKAAPSDATPERTVTTGREATGAGVLATVRDDRGPEWQVLYDGLGEWVRCNLRCPVGKHFVPMQAREHNALREVANLTRYDYLPGGLMRVREEGERCHVNPDAILENRQITEKGKVTTTKTEVLDARGPELIEHSVHTVLADGGATLASWQSDLRHPEQARLEKTWDARNNLIKLQRGSGKGAATLTLEYDDLGRPVAQVMPDGAKLKRQYHGLSRLVTRLEVDGTEIGTQVVGAGGTVSSRTVGKRAYTFDENLTKQPDGTILADSRTANGLTLTRTAGDDPLATLELKPQARSLTVATATADERTTYKTERGVGLADDVKVTVTTARGSYTGLEARTLGGALVAALRTDGARLRRWEGAVAGQDRRQCQDHTDWLCHYDAHGRALLARLSDPHSGGQQEIRSQYDTFGQLIALRHRLNGEEVLRVEQTWTAVGQLASKATFRQGAEPSRETYAYDACGRLTEYACDAQHPLDEASGLAIAAQTFTWDGLTRLTRCVTRFATDKNRTQTYAYSAEHPTQWQSLTTAWAGGETTTAIAQWSNNGYLIKNEQGQQLAYNKRGQLASVKDSASNLVTRYHYDGYGRLAAQYLAKTEQTRELYYDSQGALCGERWYGKDKTLVKTLCLGQALSQYAVADGKVASVFGLEGGQGAVAQAHLSGAVSMTHTAYGPFGETGEPLTLCRGYNGDRRDPVTGVYHPGDGVRDYAPRLRQFCQPDSESPFGEGGVNDYAYCGGDPVNRIDPSGHIMLSRWGQEKMLSDLNDTLKNTQPYPVGSKWRGLAVSFLTAVAGVVLGALTAGAGLALFIASTVLAVVSFVCEVLATFIENETAKKWLGLTSLVTGIASIGNLSGVFKNALKLARFAFTRVGQLLKAGARLASKGKLIPGPVRTGSAYARRLRKAPLGRKLSELGGTVNWRAGKWLDKADEVTALDRALLKRVPGMKTISKVKLSPAVEQFCETCNLVMDTDDLGNGLELPEALTEVAGYEKEEAVVTAGTIDTSSWNDMLLARGGQLAA